MKIGFFLFRFLSTIISPALFSPVVALLVSFPLVVLLRLRNGTYLRHTETLSAFSILCLRFPRSSSKSVSPRITVFSPIATNRWVCFFISCKSQRRSSTEVVISKSCSLSHFSSISSPFFWVSRASFRRIAITLLFALAVETTSNHDFSTRCAFEVRISTWSPLCSLWLNGTSLWFTFAPIQWLPRNVCIWKAKSSAVHPAGIIFISPFGVNTNISEANRFSFMASRKSIASGCGSSSISFMVCSQSFSSPSSSVISVPSLYFQWAANPCSAISSIRSERIWTSIHWPCFDISVTCKAW